VVGVFTAPPFFNSPQLMKYMNKFSNQTPIKTKEPGHKPGSAIKKLIFIGINYA